MNAGHIEYTYVVSKPNSDWQMEPVYTVTVLAQPNDRTTAVRYVAKWVTANCDATKYTCSSFTYTLKNADLPCYDDNAMAWVELVSAEVHADVVV